MSSLTAVPISDQHTPKAGPVVCFGMITPARVLVVDELPDWNSGAVWTEGAEFISDDAAIVAGLLAGWGVDTELVGSALGDDDAGRKTVGMLRKMGVKGRFELRKDIETPFEVNVSDSRGGRTYYWNRRPELLRTLDDADLSALSDARMLYVDWYDAPHIERAMSQARRLDVPVFLNIEHAHQDADILASLAPYATVCQAVTDASQFGGDGKQVAKLLAENGVSSALVTLASQGALGMRNGTIIHVEVPALDVVDTCGAGATFSAAYINSWSNGSDLERSLRFAVAAASLKCSVVGPKAFPPEEIDKLADTLSVTRMS
ncbi:MAG: carbohydrate kinase family protein [Dehalococcoidia bacterium]|nr:carbohydrate kinase family protein [Dehalococcoidia bacterium]